MSVPNFLHVMANGDIWHSIDQDFTPSGTTLAVFRVCPEGKTQKIGTISGNSGSYAVSGATGRRGNDIT